MKKKICYVVLHYKNGTMTENCVDSLVKIIGDDAQVIIVDNGSNNGSLEEVTSYYKEEKKIDIITTGENLGYAKGNNFGYKYARKYDPVCVVFCNNDLLFEDSSFEEQILGRELYLKYDVFGPDIINCDGIHQNPHRYEMLTLKDIRIKNFKKRLFLIALKIKKKINIAQKIVFLEKQFEQQIELKKKSYSNHMVLQGSCIAVGKRFIIQEEKVFLEDTFLYFEEDLLALKCQENGYNSGIIDEIFVRHLEGGTIKNISREQIDTWIFRIENLYKSGKVYEKKLKERIKK